MQIMQFYLAGDNSFLTSMAAFKSSFLMLTKVSYFTVFEDLMGTKYINMNLTLHKAHLHTT